ncbi:MAG: hypothetical protein ACODAF_01945 [Actinomycetota bacterium]
MAAGVAVLGLALAACGEDGGSADGTSNGGSDDSTSAAEADEGSGDQSDDESDDESSDDSGEAPEFSISEGKGGGADLFEAMTDAHAEVGSYHFEMDMASEGEQISAQGGAEFGGDASATRMRMDMEAQGTGEMSMLFIDGVLYFSLPPDAGLPTDTAWLRFDTEGDDSMAEAFGFGDLAEEMSQSAEMQSDFAEHSDIITVEEGGTDTVDGVDVTEYVLTISAEDAAEYLEGTGQAAGGGAASEELTYSLWLDGDMLTRKMSADLGGGDSMEMLLFDFGEPVDVEAPPEDEVTDFSSLMEDMSQ